MTTRDFQVSEDLFNAFRQEGKVFTNQVFSETIADDGLLTLALKTNAWSNGKLLKDYGKFHPEEKVMFEFGEPLRVQGNDREVHQAIGDFIESRLREWGVPVA